MPSRQPTLRLACVVVALALAVGLGGGWRSVARAAEAGRSTPNPLVVGPVSGGKGQPLGHLRYDVTQYGYQEREYFFEGTARAYGSDASPMPYRTRMIVWTPADPRRFNGTTVVEWAELAGYELNPMIFSQSPMLVREGYAFVLVSAQQGGVCTELPTGCAPTSMKGHDPDRYGPLSHPGDDYSFDIFSQALQAIKHPVRVAPLGPLKAGTVIVEGFQVMDGRGGRAVRTSEAVGMLNAYITNGADADARLADAFLVDTAEPLDPSLEFRVPTLSHLTEDWVPPSPIPDTRNHVTWEVAGAPHADRWAIDHSGSPATAPTTRLSREEEEARRDRFDDYGQNLDPGAAVCAPSNLNMGNTSSVFPRRFTLNAATTALRQWARTGNRAPAAPRLERADGATATPTTKFRRDRDGNALGGLRSPVIEVPVAAYVGEMCSIFGASIPFSPTRVTELYPSHESYVRKLLSATDEAMARGFLVCLDATTIMRKASASTIGGTDRFEAAPACASRRSRAAVAGSA